MKKIIIYGAGNYGKMLYLFLQKINTTVSAFCQSEKDERKQYCNIPLLSLNELIKQYNSTTDNLIVLIAIAEQNVSETIKLKLRSLLPDNVMVFECGNFISDNQLELITAGQYCIACNMNIENFVPGGVNSPLFRKHKIIGGGYRDNMICPVCLSADRDRFNLWIMNKCTDITNKKCTVLHMAPEPAIEKVIRKNKKCDYYSGDIEQGRADHIVDLTNINFADNTFDYVIAHHVLEHIQDEECAMKEIIRVLKPEGKLLISFPICVDRKTYEDVGVILPEEREEVFGQKDHVRLYGIDFKEYIEKFGLNVQVHSPKAECTEEQIKKYGFLRDDITLICTVNK